MKLTENQRDILQECYNRELDKEEPCTNKLLKSNPELLSSGYLDLNLYTNSKGKRKAGYTITKKGKEWLLKV
jgi:hypothetical protein